MSHQISSDGRTVWVNSSIGHCIGRFCPLGVDIHKEFEDQARGEPACLHCTSEKTGLREWRLFQVLMRRYYDVGVDDQHMPIYVRRELLAGEQPS